MQNYELGRKTVKKFEQMVYYQKYPEVLTTYLEYLQKLSLGVCMCVVLSYGNKIQSKNWRHILLHMSRSVLAWCGISYERVLDLQRTTFLPQSKYPVLH